MGNYYIRCEQIANKQRLLRFLGFMSAYTATSLPKWIGHRPFFGPKNVRTGIEPLAA